MSYEEGRQCALDLNASYFEVSTAINTNVSSVFESAITQLLGKLGIEEDEELEDSDGGREAEIQEYYSATTSSQGNETPTESGLLDSSSSSGTLSQPMSPMHQSSFREVSTDPF